ncbi:MAG: hypothetical protein E7422_05465 [Ruminococcaceae bacterium]|nr:hypothetical protein [Oscillospiraceae bacterium]
MNMIRSMHPHLYAAASLICFLTILLCQYSLLRILRRRQRRMLSVNAALGSLAGFVLLQYLLGRISLGLSAAWTVALVIALLSTALQIAYLSLRFSAEHIEAASIKQSVDGVPVGICCYWPGGLVKLVNGRMEELSYELTGGAPLNGERLWQTLERGEGRGEYLQTGENPVVRLSDGRVWSVRRESVALESGTICELMAVEMTDEYAANEELRKKRERVGAFNARLRALSREIERMTVEKEVLAAKVSVHDDLSRALLYAKQYYKDPGARDRETMLRIWSEAIRFVRSEGPEHWRDLYAYVHQVASELGVTVEVDGTLPHGEAAEELVSDALITCLINATRHGGADKLTVTVRETADEYTLRIANNGAAPENGVTEAGGLKNLREKLERAGGTMREESGTAFALIVELPKKEKEDAVSSIDRG